MNVTPVAISTAKKATKKVTVAKLGNKNIQVPDALPAKVILDYFESVQNEPVGIIADKNFLATVLGEEQMTALMEADGFEVQMLSDIVSNVLSVVLAGN